MNIVPYGMDVETYVQDECGSFNIQGGAIITLSIFSKILTIDTP